MVELIKTIGGVISPTLVIFSFLAMIFKPLRTRIIKWIKRTTNTEENASWIVELQSDVQKIREMMTIQCDASQALLRDSICKLYYKFNDEKTLPPYEKENLVELFEKYHDLGGNHFVDLIYGEMKTWPIKKEGRG